MTAREIAVRNAASKRERKVPVELRRACLCPRCQKERRR